MSKFGDAADVNLVIKFLPLTCNVCGRNLITASQLYSWLAVIGWQDGRLYSGLVVTG